jgi:hypothetical protein
MVAKPYKCPVKFRLRIRIDGLGVYQDSACGSPFRGVPGLVVMFLL